MAVARGCREREKKSRETGINVSPELVAKRFKIRSKVVIPNPTTQAQYRGWDGAKYAVKKPPMTRNNSHTTFRSTQK
jgi:hypothetical protein